ncbi:MAG: fused MFS/spermidine synthase [Tatlockia sp.]|nr:fused MFS/spermidine synthase [Tatlockia sp.]
MVAKIILPIYGGTPAVWTLCMLFFQLELLAAYAYAWFLSRFKNPWIWRLTHLLLIGLSLMAFPLHLTPTLGNEAPDLSLLQFLVEQLGLPLLVIGASAPLLQFAYSQTRAKAANDPYFLYVLSNLGSLLALLSYPFMIEAYIGLNLQLRYWSWLFLIYLLSLFFVFFAVTYSPQLVNPIKKENVNRLETLRGIFYSFVPCSLMLGLTFYITTDIAATPLFWILPLSLYLLSFIITFAKKPLISHDWVMRNVLLFIIFPIIGFITGANLLQIWELILFHLSAFFILALLCHGELVKLRPPVSQLTRFYFCLALGGVLAGLFNGLIAPRLFSSAFEYPMVFALSLLCINLPKAKGFGFAPFAVLILVLINYFLPDFAQKQWFNTYHVLEILAFCLLIICPKNKITFFSGMTILFVFIFSPLFKQTEILNQQRNFYGVKQVILSKGMRILLSQNTLHGFQMLNVDKFASGAMAYYGSTIPVIKELQKKYQSLHAIIIGLGTGMMACQFQAQDSVKIIDIDEQVIDIAHKYFSYLDICPPSISLVQGDGRIAVKESGDAGSHLLVIDAFSSDAIPTHFLTLEAFQLYRQKIAAKGVILVNISNRHLKLLPVIMAAGRQLQLMVLHKIQKENLSAGQFGAEWVLLTADEQLGSELMKKEGWRFVADNDGQLWTDDHSNLMPLMKWYS